MNTSFKDQITAIQIARHFCKETTVSGLKHNGKDIDAALNDAASSVAYLNLTKEEPKLPLEYRGYTIQKDHRNPYGEPEFMYYDSEQGIQHDADGDSEGYTYCGNCYWSSDLEEAKSNIDDLIIEHQGKCIENLEGSLKKILKYIEDGYLVRDTSNDHSPDWAIKQLPFLNDLGKASKLVAP